MQPASVVVKFASNRQFSVLLTLAALAAAAHLTPPGAAAAEPAAGGEQAAKVDGKGQGIFGRIEKLVGNFQPQVVGPGQRPPAARGGRVPLAVPVHVFRGRVKTFSEPAPDHPALVAIGTADKDGGFRVPLDPGEYAVVAEIDGTMHTPVLLDSGEWPTVRVEPGKWLQLRIEETSEAAF
jgi:hypothetical protein